MDNILFIFAIAFSVAVIVAVAFRAIRKNNQSYADKNAPVLSVNARVLSRSISLRGAKETGTLAIATDTLDGIVVFETENKEVLEFSIKGKPFRDILNGDEGVLTCQGKTFISFERKV